MQGVTKKRAFSRGHEETTFAFILVKVKIGVFIEEAENQFLGFEYESKLHDEKIAMMLNMSQKQI